MFLRAFGALTLVVNCAVGKSALAGDVSAAAAPGPDVDAAFAPTGACWGSLP